MTKKQSNGETKTTQQTPAKNSRVLMRKKLYSGSKVLKVEILSLTPAAKRALSIKGSKQSSIAKPAKSKRSQGELRKPVGA